MKQAQRSCLINSNIDRGLGRVVGMDPVKGDFLTKDDYIKLFDRCSDLLHAENPFSSRGPRGIGVFLNAAPSFSRKIKRLLNHHTVQLTADRERILAVVMNRKGGDGSVGAWEFKRLHPGDPMYPKTEEL